MCSENRLENTVPHGFITMFCGKTGIIVASFYPKIFMTQNIGLGLKKWKE
jgi:hypothetical protein